MKKNNSAKKDFWFSAVVTHLVGAAVTFFTQQPFGIDEGEKKHGKK